MFNQIYILRVCAGFEPQLGGFSPETSYQFVEAAERSTNGRMGESLLLLAEIGKGGCD